MQPESTCLAAGLSMVRLTEACSGLSSLSEEEGEWSQIRQPFCRPPRGHPHPPPFSQPSGKARLPRSKHGLHTFQEKNAADQVCLCRLTQLANKVCPEGWGHAQVPRLVVIGPQGPACIWESPAWLCESGKAAPKRFPARDTRSPQNTQNSGSQHWLSWKPPRDLETTEMPGPSPEGPMG